MILIFIGLICLIIFVSLLLLTKKYQENLDSFYYLIALFFELTFPILGVFLENIFSDTSLKALMFLFWKNCFFSLIASISFLVYFLLYKIFICDECDYYHDCEDFWKCENRCCEVINKNYNKQQL